MTEYLHPAGNSLMSKPFARKRVAEMRREAPKVRWTSWVQSSRPDLAFARSVRADPMLLQHLPLVGRQRKPNPPDRVAGSPGIAAVTFRLSIWLGGEGQVRRQLVGEQSEYATFRSVPACHIDKCSYCLLPTHTGTTINSLVSLLPGDGNAYGPCGTDEKGHCHAEDADVGRVGGRSRTG